MRLRPHHAQLLCRLIVAIVISTTPLAAWSDNWAQWRGPNQNNVAAGTGYPTRWGEKENVLWKIKIPGWGTSTPAIWEDKIFVTGDENGSNQVICLNREGKKLWQVEAGVLSANKNRKAGSANPSPVTDGKYVYAYFKSGDLICLDFDSKVVWKTNLQKRFGPDRLNWDLGTSPVLTRSSVVIAVMHQGPSYVVAFDKATGEQLWKQERDLGAPAEARDSYSTPIVLEEGAKETLVVLGGDFVNAYDASDGKERWRLGGLNPEQARNFRSIASPVVVDDLIVAPYARGRTVTGIRRGGSGDVTGSHVLWTEYGGFCDVPAPVAHDGRVYLCGDRGDVFCLEAKSGKEIWRHALPRNRYPYSSSPILAENRLYLTREDGTTFVLETGDEPKLVATNALFENTYSTPAFVDGRIYLRTSDYLFCLGTK